MSVIAVAWSEVIPVFAVLAAIASDCSAVITVFALLLIMSEACCAVMPTFAVFNSIAIVFVSIDIVLLAIFVAFVSELPELFAYIANGTLNNWLVPVIV